MASLPNGKEGALMAFALVYEMTPLPLGGAQFRAIQLGFCPRNMKLMTFVEKTGVPSSPKVVDLEIWNSKLVPGAAGRHSQFNPLMP